MESKIDKLNWVRVFTPIHIPKYLVEQVRDRAYSVEDFYKYQEGQCLIQKKEGPTLNPFNHLYVLVDDENLVKGYLWFNIDPLSKEVIINTFSMDKEYWGQGQAVKKLQEHVKEILSKLKLTKVFWLTNFPKHSMRNGFKRSKTVLMEYEEQEDGKNSDGGHDPTRRREHAQSGAGAVI